MIETKVKMNISSNNVGAKVGVGYATREEIKAIEKGRRQIESGEFYTLEQVLREYAI